MLKRTLTAALFILFACTAGSAYAQNGVITGTVVDSTTSETIPGANVVVSALNAGAATGGSGQFRIPGIPAGSYTLQASFVGYVTKAVPVTVEAGETTQVQIALAPETVALQDVVVTALGIEREERSLGYSVQEVDGAALEQTAETNFIGSLTGQVAGAQIDNSSQMGGSSRIVLRGASSVSGNNQPLIVVDGVPLDNSGFNSIGQETGSGGFDYGNAASMINPSNVQSVSVLKGPSAAALYGSRAANGVIEVTTRNGSAQDGIGVTIQQGVTANNLYNLPNYQNEYGGGSWSPFSTNDDGQLVADFGTDQSWGPRLDGRDVRQWYSYDDVNGLEGETTPWVARPNNVDNFFRTGITSTTNVAFSQGGESFNYRLSLRNMSQQGNSPESSMDRRSLSFNGALDLTDRLSTQVTANYIDESAKGRPGSGYTNATGPWLQFNHFGQRQIDLSDDAPMRDITRVDGTQRGWNWTGDPRAGNLIYANNPFWIRERNYQNDGTNRVYGRVSVSYDLAENLTISTNARTDYYTSRRQERVAIGSVEQSNYSEDVREVQESNFGAEINYNGQLTEDFDLQAVGGANYRYSNFSRNYGDTEGGLASEDLYTLENSISRPAIDDYFQEQALLGLFADATVGYRDLAYLGGSLRNDWSSTLPEDNNRYLYPSVTASFVFSSLPAFDNSVLSYGKIRANWSQVGRDTDPYQLSFTYPLGTPYGSTQVQGLPNTLPNLDLKPEIKTGWEVGAQAQFLQNRIGLDATYYSEETRNQILPVGASRASGYTARVINSGTISNKGVELTLNGSPVVTEDFTWDVTLNWSKNVNEVVELAEGVTSIPLNQTDASPPFGPQIVAREGEPYGSFFGPGFVFDDNGNKVVGSGGTYEQSAPRVLGSYLPDWNGSISTQISYNNFTASVLVDGQKGGEIWSLSNLFGLYSGIFQETVEGNIRQVGIVPDGVTADGQEWTGRVDPNTFFSSLFGNNEAHLYDASYIKLREINLSYTLPQQWFAGGPVRDLTVSAIGRNLATLLKYTPNFDPTAVTRSAGNLQGIEAGQMPPSRTLGVRVSLTL